jgi:hypothetical protein
MKKLSSALLALMLSLGIKSQNIGIGTSTPSASAMLDISSTSKGLLIPRMTSVQRSAIASPAAGLMVYDTDRKLFYQHDGGIWRLMLNNDFWNRATATSNYMVNLQDSVGIGTTGPTERLDVNGNIRIRNNLFAADAVNAGSLIAAGNLVVGTTGLINGDLTTNSDMVINNTTATLQLKSNSVNKGFFQLSGNDVRFGTNSGNSTGNLIIRMNGSNRITVNPAGDMDIDGKLTRSAVTGSANLLPLWYGKVDADGTVLSGSGNFSVNNTSTGYYQLSSTEFSDNTTIVVTANKETGNGYPIVVTAEYNSLFSFRYYLIVVRNTNGVLYNGKFSFIAYQ